MPVGSALLQLELDTAIRIKNWKPTYIMVIYLKVSEVFAFIQYLQNLYGSQFNAVRGKKFILEPLTTGLVVNYSFGKQYFSFDPPNYPYRYYSFPTAIHSALFLGSRIGFNFPANTFVRRLSLYYEILSFDREIISLVSNPKSLHITDIVTLSLGVKINIE